MMAGVTIMETLVGCDNGTTSTNSDTLIGSWQAEGIEITFASDGTVVAKQSNGGRNTEGQGVFEDKKTEVTITYTKYTDDGGATWKAMTGEGAKPQTAPYSFLDGKLLMGGVTYTRK
jgi:hypothetical protein